MKSWSLSRKIWSIVGLLVIAFVGTSIFQGLQTTYTQRELEFITNVIVKRNQLAATLRDNQRLLRITTLELVVFSEPTKLSALDSQFKSLVEKQHKDIDAYKLLSSEKEGAAIKEYLTGFDQFVVDLTKVKEHAVKNEDEKAHTILSEADVKAVKLVKDLDEMIDLTNKELISTSEHAVETAKRGLWLSIFAASGSIALSLIIAFFVLRNLGRAVGVVVQNLLDNSTHVSSAASQISSSADSLSQSTREQATSLEQTAASIEQMNSIVAKNSQNANIAAQTSEKSRQNATEGKAVVERMVQSMSHIDQSNSAIMEQVTSSNQRLAEIVQVIEEIGTKTNVINDIVFQTKLLSFNASVEAARAGEHGKGFAVVAEEVGNLAQMSGNAAKEIKSMLDGSLAKVHDIVDETKTKVERMIDNGRTTVSEGTGIAQECGDVLEEIVTNFSSVSKMAREIAAANQEQSRGVSEITKAMNQLDQVTQTNATTSQQCANSAEELSNQATSLKKSVSDLVRTINGQTQSGA